MKFSKCRITFAGIGLIACLSLVACGDPAERSAHYIKKGNEYFDVDDFQHARIEYKNAAKLRPTDAEPRYRLGLVEESEGNLRSAFADFLFAVQQDAHYLPALYKLTNYYLASSALDKAESTIGEILTTSPDDAEGHALRAILLLRNKKNEEAEKEALFALTKDSTNATAYAALVSIYADPQKSAAAIEEGIKNNPRSLSLQILKAKLYATEKNLPKMAEAFQAVFDLKPKDVRYRAQLAEIYAKLGHIDEAEASLRAGVEAMPNDDDMRHHLIAFLNQHRGLEVTEAEIKNYVDAHPDKDKYLLWLAEIYTQHNMIDKTVSLLNQISSKHSNDEQGFAAQAVLARISYIKGNRDEAAKQVESIIDKDPNNFDALTLKGRLAFDAGRDEDAIALLRSVTRAHPKSIEALQLLGDIFSRQGRSDLALDTFNQIAEIVPDNNAVKLRIAQLYQVKGETRRAMDMLFLITKAEPQNNLAWETTARAAIANKEWDTAQSAVAALGKIDGQHLVAQFLQGQIYDATNKTSEAVTEYQKIIDTDASTALAERALTAYADDQRKLGRTADAIAYIGAIKSPTVAVQTVLAECFINAGKIQEATTLLDQILSTNPSRIEPYIDRARIALNVKNSAAAIDILHKAAKAAPDDIRAPMLEAEIFNQTGQIEPAIKIYEGLLARNSSLDIAANNLAEILADNKADDEKAMDRAVQLVDHFSDTDNPLLLDTVGWVYLQKGATQKAQTVFERAFAHDTGTFPPQMHYHYGALLIKIGDTVRAKKELQKAIATDALYPGLDKAKELLKGL
jgi:tetratricopeptide (TPR) repeat protein